MPLKPSEEENKYFLALEAQRRKDLRKAYEKAAEELARQEKTARAAGIDDLGLAARLRSLGFDGENARVLDVLPLVLVAWADGSVSSAERAVVMRAVEARGVDPHGEAGLKVAALLEKKPSPAMENEILLILQDLVALDQRRGADIATLCTQVAEATRTLFGLGTKISDEERALLGRIAGQFQTAAHAQIKEKLS